MNIDNKLNVRYMADVPFLRYIVPFSYGHNHMNYEEAVNKIMSTGEWKAAKRSDLVPSHEEDLYDHIYSGFVDSKLDPDGGGTLGNNIGAGFVSVNFKRKGMYYHYHEKANDELNDSNRTKQNNESLEINGKKYDPTRRILNFTIEDEGIFIFRTGIGFYWYEIKLPEMDADHLVLFQNRFKELNVIRLTRANSDKFWFCNKKEPGEEKFTMGTYISLKLHAIFGDVYYYPPRVNEIVRNKKIEQNRKQWKEYAKSVEEERKLNEDRQQAEGKAREKYQYSEEFDLKLKAFHAEKHKWENLCVSQAKDMGFIDGYPMLVPDRALLFCYVAFNAEKDVETEEEKQKLIGDMCKYAYFISRGYKESYKVTKNAELEKKHMFLRHENDIWDASLEGVGCFVSIYNNVYNKDGSIKSNTFYDKNRVKEMKGDYFILYLLLLYQHYTLIYFFQTMSNRFSFQPDDYKEYNESLYNEIYAFKVGLDIFLSGSVYEAVSHTTDICNLYSYIEDKMMIRGDYENLKRSVSNLENLQSCLLEKKKEAEEEEIGAEKDDFDKTLGIAGAIIGGLAVLSSIKDVIDLVDTINTKIPLGDIGYVKLMAVLLGFVGLIALIAGGVIIKYFRNKKKRKK